MWDLLITSIDTPRWHWSALCLDDSPVSAEAAGEEKRRFGHGNEHERSSFGGL